MTTENTPSAALQAVLHNQQAIAAAEATAEQLRTALNDQANKAASLSAQAAAVASLQTEREDLLADNATGQDKSKELAALEAKLAKHQQTLVEQGSQASVDQTVAGLKRKLDRTEEEAAALREQGKALLRALVLERAETLGAEYKAAALQIEEMYMRLIGQRQMLLGMGQGAGGFHRIPDLQVPAFPFTTTRSPLGQMNDRFIVETSLDLREKSAAAFADEQASLRALGVELR